MERTQNLWKEIARLALPIAFGQFLVALVGASDAVMLGNLDQNAMSAVSLATQVTFVFNLFMAAFLIGENMFVAQYYGKRDAESISKVFRLVLCISCGTAVCFWLGTFFFPEQIMRFFTNEEELAASGAAYLKVVGISYLFSAVAQVCMTLMKNCGAVNQSTLVSSVAVVLNILLNAVFILGLWGVPKMGIRGAAFATVLATAVQAVWSAVFVLRKKGWRKPRPFTGSPELTRHFWKRTGPVLLNELVWGGGFTMYSVIMGHLGADAVAANGIANIAKNLIVCLCLGLGSAGSILVGNRLGADAFEEAKQMGKTLTRAAILCGAASGAVLLMLSPLILRMVELAPEAAGYLKGMLVVCAYYLVGKSVNSMTVGGIFPAGGDSRFGLLCDAVTLWGVTIPLGSLCAFVWKLPVLVVYVVLNLDEIVKLPVVYRHYKKYNWVKNIT
ncbi:MAG: MATE family efflux transporter [Eubacteriales bacterium]|nr:MATE family efflux transporter [Eubacteriales bacterium]